MSAKWTAADRIANRVDGEKVGMDPALLTVLISSLLPLLVRCGQDNDEMTASSAYARIRQLHGRNPDRLERRMVANIRRQDRSLSRAQAQAIAQAMIEEALNSGADEVEAVAGECCEAVDAD